MDRVRCTDCGEVFRYEDTADHYEYHRLDGEMYKERWGACPHCGSIDLEDVGTCPICGEWINEEGCEHCREDIRAIVQSALELSKTKEGKEAILEEIQNILEETET